AMDTDNEFLATSNFGIRPSEEDDHIKLNLWEKEKDRQTMERTLERYGLNDENFDVPEAYIDTEENPHLASELMQLSETDKLHAIAEKYGLNKEQKRAYMLFCNHRQLTDTLNRSDGLGNPDILPSSQMLLCVSGEGGTGKSRVIEAVCTYFEAIGRRS